MENESIPTTSPVVEKLPELPVCASCRNPLEEIRYLDYERLRVVFHAGKGCVVGVVNIPN